MPPRDDYYADVDSQASTEELGGILQASEADADAERRPFLKAFEADDQERRRDEALESALRAYEPTSPNTSASVSPPSPSVRLAAPGKAIMNPWPRLPPAELREVELVVEWQRLGRDTVPSDGVIEHRAFRGVTDEGDAQRRGEDASAQRPAGLEAAPVAVGGDAPAQTPAGFEAVAVAVGGDAPAQTPAQKPKAVAKPPPTGTTWLSKANLLMKRQKLMHLSEQGPFAIAER